MQVPATADLNPSTAMTMELWGKLPADVPVGYLSNMYFAQKLCANYSSPSYSLGLGDPGYSTGNNIKCRILKKADTDAAPVTISIEAPFSLPRDVWTHLAMTYDAAVSTDNFRLYANGTLVAKTTVVGNLFSTVVDSPLVVGANTSQTGATFHIDELRIWSKARTQAEILADMTKSLAGIEPGLCAYYNFNDTSKDITGRGNDGVLHYMETFAEMTAAFPPYMASISPANGATDVATTTQLSLTFNEGVTAGSGDITVFKSAWNGAVVETIDVTDSAKVAISGAKVTVTLSNLLETSTKYYVKIPGTCLQSASSGLFFIGVMSPDTWSFTTNSFTMPTVTTATVSSISATTATSGGNVTSEGGATVTERGVCWSTLANPTTADSKTIDGSGPGPFTSSITGLIPNTTYYVRAYATNSAGTAYGSGVSFKTSYAKVLYVSGSGYCGDKEPCYTSIQTAIENAKSGAIILIANGDYTEPMTLNENKPLTLQGGWDASCESRVGTTILSNAPKAPKGSLTLQNLKITP